MEKMYGIEERESDYYGSHRYRFYSLYNGARGAWHHNKERAIKDGEAHQRIIRAVHGTGITLYK